MRGFLKYAFTVAAFISFSINSLNDPNKHLHSFGWVNLCKDI